MDNEHEFTQNDNRKITLEKTTHLIFPSNRDGMGGQRAWAENSTHFPAVSIPETNLSSLTVFKEFVLSIFLD